jgi:hypothetical protein
MESIEAHPGDVDPAARLRELERAEALPYVVYPATPWWFMPAMGLYLGGLVASYELFGRFHNLLPLAVLVVLTVFVGAVISVVKSRYGAFPELSRNAPLEIRGAYRRAFTGLAVIAVVVAAVWLWVGPAVAGLVTFVLITAGDVLYEAYYATAASRARARLGIDVA